MALQPATAGLQYAVLCIPQFRIQIVNKFFPVFPREQLFPSPRGCRAAAAAPRLVLLQVGGVQPSRAMETSPWWLVQLAGTMQSETDIVV